MAGPAEVETAPICLFCENPAGSKEHLWAAWIHERKDFGPVRVKIGASPLELRNDPAQTINSVCPECNHGWMSATENSAKPIIGPTLEDLTFQLDRQWQTLLSNWAVKTAMVLDSVKAPEVNAPYYSRPECMAFRQRRIVPKLTRVWVGRYSAGGLGAYGTDVAIGAREDLKRVGSGSATTVIVGHLGVQVFAFRVNPDCKTPAITDVQPKPGDWGNLLTQIWPVQRDSVTWPPKETFTIRGPRSIATLMDRWRIGDAVLKLSSQ